MRSGGITRGPPEPSHLPLAPLPSSYARAVTTSWPTPPGVDTLWASLTMKTEQQLALPTEPEYYGHVQQEFIRHRSEEFDKAEAHSRTMPWLITRLAGFTTADRKLWRGIYRVAIAFIIAATAYSIWVAVDAGEGLIDAAARIAFCLTLGTAVGTRWGFRYLVRSEHDRYPLGRDFEYASASQSERAGLAHVGAAARDWQHPRPTWAPDAPSEGVASFVAVVFAASCLFLFVAGLLGWADAATAAAGCSEVPKPPDCG